MPVNIGKTFQDIKTARDLGAPKPGDVLIAERIPGQTGAITYAVKVQDDPAPTLGANLTLNGKSVIGNLSVNNYNSGTNASATTFLCGDNTWKDPTVAYGKVNTGTAGQIAYYATNGNTVSGTTNLTGFPLGTPASGNLSNCTSLPVSTGISGLGAGISTFLATPSSANFAAAITDETGSGSVVLATSPTLITPILGIPTSGTLTNCTGLPVSTGISGLGTGVATALQVNTGSAGAFVLFNGALGTPSSGTLTSCTGLPISTGVSGLGTNVATFLATPSSANLASAVTDETGSGLLVFGTSPTVTTPNIVGVSNGSTSTAGSIGEVVTQTNTAVSLTSSSVVNVASVALTAGKWFLTGSILYKAAGSTQVASVAASLSTTSGTSDTFLTWINTVMTTGAQQGLTAPGKYINVSSSTTVYLVGFSVFTISTMTCDANIIARRVG